MKKFIKYVAGCYGLEPNSLQTSLNSSDDVYDWLSKVSKDYGVHEEDLRRMWQQFDERKEMGCITITFGDQAENHVGMEKIGEAAENGFTIEDLEHAYASMTAKGYECELIKLHEGIQEAVDPAAVLIIRKAVANPDELFDELKAITWDSKAFMYGRVVNKLARHNVCFYHTSQEPDYEAGKGRIVAYDDVPILKGVRESLPDIVGEKARDLAGEGNYYYDVTKCGIGFHGDSERKKVVAIRLGNSPPLHYQWFRNSAPVGERMVLDVCHGDMYIMSEKAVGTDWKRKKIFTLRHATGCKKFTEK